MDRAVKEALNRYLESELKKLSEVPYLELEQMQSRTDIEPPPGLENFQIAREIKQDEFGGLEVSVFHYSFGDKDLGENYMAIKEAISTAIGEEEIEVLESTFGPSFYIQPNGEIDWADTEHPDGED